MRFINKFTIQKLSLQLAAVYFHKKSYNISFTSNVLLWISLLKQFKLRIRNRIPDQFDIVIERRFLFQINCVVMGICSFHQHRSLKVPPPLQKAEIIKTLGDILLFCLIWLSTLCNNWSGQPLRNCRSSCSGSWLRKFDRYQCQISSPQANVFLIDKQILLQINIPEI